MDTPTFTIAVVERETGLSKEVLRVWERRYGFPSPERDEHGERRYPADQVEHLRLIKRLMDQGHRPGKLIASPFQDLAALSPKLTFPHPKAAPEAPCLKHQALLEMIRKHQINEFQQALQQDLARQGLKSFVQDTIAPLTQEVGEAWEKGLFQVYEEHLFTELSKRLLRQAISSMGGGKRRPRIMLTSVPDEEHMLGLLMAEALFTLEGAECVPMGTEMPLLEIARAAEAHRVDVVALSFSVAFPLRQIAPLLQQLRKLLPENTALWAGGSILQKVTPPSGVTHLPTLEDGLAALAQWRSEKEVQQPL